MKTSSDQGKTLALEKSVLSHLPIDLLKNTIKRAKSLLGQSLAIISKITKVKKYKNIELKHKKKLQKDLTISRDINQACQNQEAMANQECLTEAKD